MPLTTTAALRLNVLEPTEVPNWVRVQLACLNLMGFNNNFGAMSKMLVLASSSIAMDKPSAYRICHIIRACPEPKKERCKGAHNDQPPV